MNNGHSVQFDLKQKNQMFYTSATKQWFPDEEFIFKPAQFHFHKGHTFKNQSMNGAEHTLDGVHYDMEMHIVSMNENKHNKDKLIAAVTGIIFQGNATE